MNILIVDNNREFAEMTREYLQAQEGFHIAGMAGDGWSAYNMIVERQPDIVVLDVIMPHLDGLGLLEKMREEAVSPKPDVIVLSGIGRHEGIIQSVLRLGAADYMAKPIRMGVLAEKIRELAENRSSCRC